jgi:hypothetical protein
MFSYVEDLVDQMLSHKNTLNLSVEPFDFLFQLFCSNPEHWHSKEQMKIDNSSQSRVTYLDIANTIIEIEPDVRLSIFILYKRKHYAFSCKTGHLAKSYAWISGLLSRKDCKLFLLESKGRESDELGEELTKGQTLTHQRRS